MVGVARSFAGVRPLRVAITPFARYCTGLGIDPIEVTQATLDGYGAYLEDFCLRTRPREALLDLRRAWNRAAEQNYSACPLVRFSVDDRRPRLFKTVVRFPGVPKGRRRQHGQGSDTSHQLIRAQANPADQRQGPRDPSSRAGVCRYHQRFVIKSSLKSIADLIEIDTFAAGLEHILDRLGGKNSVHVHQIAKISCTVARRWVKVPKSHQEQLETIRKNLDPGHHGMTEKNRATLRMFEDPNVVARFDSVPTRVWKRTQASEVLTVASAVRLQTALAVELLTIAPVRIGNLASIDIDRHIIDRGHGPHRSVHLFISKNEVKNGVELEFQMPGSTIALLDRYLRDVRPRLLRAPSPWLFPGEGADHKCTTLLADQIADLIETDGTVPAFGWLPLPQG